MPGSDHDHDRESPATATPPLIDVQAARVQFGALVAVYDVSMSLRAGDLVGLVGPNGAGKTTLLRAMAGLQPLAGGRVRVLGEVLEPGAPVMAQVGFTPDTPPLYEEMTVRTFLRFVAKGYGVGATDVDARIDYWLERVWLSEKEGQKVKALSRGMRQRVGIARTLLPNPAVILLDEPAAGLDPAGRVQFRRLLCELREQGKALVVSSHILSDMAEYCTHIGIMSKGQQVAGLLVFIADINALGLPTAKGLILSESFYWDRDDNTRAFAKKFGAKFEGRMPTMIHAGVYASLLHYFKAINELKSAKDGKAVVAKMEATPTDDTLFGKGTIDPNGRKRHSMYVYQVKTPEESKGKWDYYKLIREVPADQAFRKPADSGCPLVK